MRVKQIKLWSFILLSGLAMLFSILVVNPSIAVNQFSGLQNQHIFGSIDELKNPEELGLDYLLKEPIRISDSSLLNAIHQAEKDISVMPEDIPLAFDLGTNYPIKIGQLDDNKELTERTDYKAVGYVGTSGRGHTFASPFLRNMFQVESQNNGNLVITSESQSILMADTSGSFLQARRMKFISLIIYDQQVNKLYRIRANPNAVCRDALNSILNQTFGRVPNRILRRL